MSDTLNSKGTTSSMRVAMFICVITGCGVALLAVWKEQDLVGTAVLVAALIAPVVGGKVLQKAKEG